MSFVILWSASPADSKPLVDVMLESPKKKYTFPRPESSGSAPGAEMTRSSTPSLLKSSATREKPNESKVSTPFQRMSAS